MVETENVKESNPSADETSLLNATSKREEFLNGFMVMPKIFSVCV